MFEFECEKADSLLSLSVLASPIRMNLNFICNYLIVQIHQYLLQFKLLLNTINIVVFPHLSKSIRHLFVVRN